MTHEDVLRERARAHRLARRLIRFLKEGHEWDIRFMPLHEPAVRKRIGFSRSVVGAILYDRNLICIDHTYEDFFAVLIHECLHGVYPEMDEEGVQALEKMVRKHLTARQAKHLLVWAANRLR